MDDLETALRPQPGDVVTDEPPVGSVVKALADWTHTAHGWYCNEHEAHFNALSWGELNRIFGPLTLVHWS